MTGLLFSHCERCLRLGCFDDRTCDKAYIALLEKRVARWKELTRLAQERKGWGREDRGPGRGGRGLYPGEAEA